jgi:formate dehydrogenase iron-sulfur subunit
MCATKALLAGDASVVSDIYRERVAYRGAMGMQRGWGVAYGKPGVREGKGLEGKATGKD